jgi:hypothetical protein
MLIGFSSRTRFEYWRDQCVSDERHRRHDYDWKATSRKLGCNASAQLFAGQARHLYVRYQKIRLVVVNSRKRYLSVGRRPDRVAFPLKRDLQHANHVRLIVGDQNRRHVTMPGVAPSCPSTARS